MFVIHYYSDNNLTKYIFLKEENELKAYYMLNFNFKYILVIDKSYCYVYNIGIVRYIISLRSGIFYIETINNLSQYFCLYQVSILCCATPALI